MRNIWEKINFYSYKKVKNLSFQNTNVLYSEDSLLRTEHCFVFFFFVRRTHLLLCLDLLLFFLFQFKDELWWKEKSWGFVHCQDWRYYLQILFVTEQSSPHRLGKAPAERKRSLGLGIALTPAVAKLRPWFAESKARYCSLLKQQSFNRAEKCTANRQRSWIKGNAHENLIFMFFKRISQFFWRRSKTHINRISCST